MTPLAALTDYISWWQIILILVVVGGGIAYFVWRSKQEP